MTVDGNVGTKLKLNFNYDAQSSFNFDQKIKLQYDSEAFSEDDIIKKIEAGNVSLPLKGNLIQGAQSLMGIKTDLQFGHLRMTLLASQQQSKQNNVKVQNGASIVEFDDITADQYDENRHFFLSHYNRETYERSLKNLPQVLTPFRISQIEVWISDDRPDYQPGQTFIAAIADLAEPDITKYNNPSGTSFHRVHLFLTT
ncbi:MAG: cell surface protein SprA [Saprospiraceae bacterium]|nr:cell surface protein SprA [Saprospiraceae bacterium]